MITVEEATQFVQANLFVPQKEEIALTDAIGRVLAESIFADRDLPPFHRVTMDGIAIQLASFQSGNRGFKIEGMQVAGEAQKKLDDVNSCLEVMTGAVLPHAADCVVPYELVEVLDGIATLKTETVLPSQNIHVQGRDAKQGDILLSVGQKISPAEIAVMASVGKSRIAVFSLPRVAIISTGDELVDVTEIPATHQIRQSNTWALHAALKEMNVSATVFHLMDDPEAMKQRLHTIMEEHDILILSGGVSKGKFDFVPTVLANLSIQKIFHQISQRPGKPFWFGRSDHHWVFAFPGNPVSTYMCFYRYFKPWLTMSNGGNVVIPQAILATDFSFKPDLTYFLEVSVINEKGLLKAYPRAGAGSGDFANLKEVHGFLELPKGRTDFKAGEVFDYYPFR